jgi:hypothetical protein
MTDDTKPKPKRRPYLADLTRSSLMSCPFRRSWDAAIETRSHASRIRKDHCKVRMT